MCWLVGAVLMTGEAKAAESVFGLTAVLLAVVARRAVIVVGK